MREFLKALGLDQETIDSIMAEHGKLLTTSTEKITELTNEVNTLTTENTELKKVDAADLQKQIETLTEERDNLKETHTKEMDKVQFDNALELAVLGTKTIDPVGLKAHLDMTKIKYNKENKALEGFEDQIKSIQESNKHLFGNVQSTGGFQGDLGGDNNDSLEATLNEYYEN